MKTIEVYIPAVIDIEDTQEHNNEYDRVTATMRSPERTTNYAHNTFTIEKGIDPTEKILSAFGAKLHTEQESEAPDPIDESEEEETPVEDVTLKSGEGDDKSQSGDEPKE